MFEKNINVFIRKFDKTFLENLIIPFDKTFDNL